MVYSLMYRRPTAATSVDSLNVKKRPSTERSIRSGTSGMSHGIPEALSFDRIIAGGVCPPCTTRDFMNYLKYIELAPENLQFFLWYRDYCKRFDELPESEKVLSPEWRKEDSARGDGHKRSKTVGAEVSAIFEGTDFEKAPKITETHMLDPFRTPPGTPQMEEGSVHSGGSKNPSMDHARPFHADRASKAFDSAGLHWKPLTVQPYRGEITRIISIYIADGGVRQLNLSSKERDTLLHALQNTTHPSAFAEVLATVEWSLRSQAHPNFIRWTICNGNPPRVFFARFLGVSGIAGGIVAGIILTLCDIHRAWRVMSMICLLIGISTLIAAWKGMCVVLHGMHHRHLRPWELFSLDDESAHFEVKTDTYDSLAAHDSPNSFEDEPWIAKYEKRNLIRKIFDREVWIQEPALRQIQDTIFLQSLIGAIIISSIIVGIFVAIPRVNVLS